MNGACSVKCIHSCWHENLFSSSVFFSMCLTCFSIGNSLQMDLDVEDIADCHSAYVAYLIGDQVVTAQDLERYGRGSYEDRFMYCAHV